MSRMAVLALAALVVAGCAATSSSTITAASAPPKWEGPVFVSAEALPPGIKHTVVGTVQVDARAGYAGAATLYPALAAEARKIGANAVFSAAGGRRMTALSWAAPYVGGTAVRVEDPKKLEGLAGSMH
ncbi:MAG: hypothetical protein JNL85_03765 [Rubrivivax sp.]|nr:hypothetical protein [Rubrivivax sp.]